MAFIRSITIRNFKGIGEVTINFDRSGISPPVQTLIGLNESGKTTILEGLSHFVTGDNAVSNLFDGIHSKSDIAALIPVNKKAAFTGEIAISAIIHIEESDAREAAHIAEKLGFELNKNELTGDTAVSRVYKFEDSNFISQNNYWNIKVVVRKKGKAKNFKVYERPTTAGAPDLHLKIVALIRNSLPRIAYFPTFLVDMPKKIYLSEHTGEHAVNKYYRIVLQDILDSLNEGLTLEKHVAGRIEDFKESDNSSNWFSALWGGSTKSLIDSVFSKISSAVTREVLGSWQKVFQRKISAKNIQVDWGIDADKNDLPYATFSIFDGESRYYISERSLGFRWFFSFLLFTAFKQKSKRPTLFVFDEPAANLHAKAQAELLKSFTRIVSDGDGIVYSTHSHHMINPHWVSGAYIVENTALDYDSDEDTFGLNSQPTNIIATSYRHFVAQHPTRTSYFQPVIDMLEYVTPAIVGAPPFVLLEGITDYYALSLAKKISKKKYPFSLMPGVGAGASGPQISLLLGRGDSFVVVLDDDPAGRKAAERYRSDWFLTNNQVFTIAVLGSGYRGKRLEGLVSAETREKIKLHAKLSTNPTKKEIGMYFAEMCATGAPAAALSDHTLDTLERFLDEILLRITAI